jgi:hypothetical protein
MVRISLALAHRILIIIKGPAGSFAGPIPRSHLPNPVVVGLYTLSLAEPMSCRPRSIRRRCVALIVVRYADVVSPSFATSALHLSTRRRWDPYTFVSFDTSVLGSLHLRVFRHIGVGILTPSRLSTHRRWDPYTFVSFDMSVLGSLHLRVFRHVGVGFSFPSDVLCRK